jgi:hypothetical protein
MSIWWINKEKKMKLNKHSYLGCFLRGLEADNKGWGELGKYFAARTKAEKDKATKNGNRYYKLTRGE